MKTRIGIIRRPVGLLLALFVAGCAGSPPTNLYTLSAVGAPAADTRSPQSTPAVVAVGPVTCPTTSTGRRSSRARAPISSNSPPMTNGRRRCTTCCRACWSRTWHCDCRPTGSSRSRKSATPASTTASPSTSAVSTSTRPARRRSRRAGSSTRGRRRGRCSSPTTRCSDRSKVEATMLTRLRSAPCSPISATASPREVNSARASAARPLATY